MPQPLEQRLATELSIRPQQVQATIALLDEGATVPFIARYRKEVTGNLSLCAGAWRSARRVLVDFVWRVRG